MRSHRDRKTKTTPDVRARISENGRVVANLGSRRPITFGDKTTRPALSMENGRGRDEIKKTFFFFFFLSIFRTRACSGREKTDTTMTANGGCREQVVAEYIYPTSVRAHVTADDRRRENQIFSCSKKYYEYRKESTLLELVRTNRLGINIHLSLSKNPRTAGSYLQILPR